MSTRLRAVRGVTSPVGWLSRRGWVTVRPRIIGVKTKKIGKGTIFLGGKGYLEGIFGNPSLTKI